MDGVESRGQWQLKRLDRPRLIEITEFGCVDGGGFQRVMDGEFGCCVGW